MTKEQMENIIQENMQKIYLYCVKRLENTAVAEDVAQILFWSCFVRMTELQVMKQYMGISGVLRIICVRIIGEEEKKKIMQKSRKILWACVAIHRKKVLSEKKR